MLPFDLSKLLKLHVPQIVCLAGLHDAGKCKQASQECAHVHLMHSKGKELAQRLLEGLRFCNSTLARMCTAQRRLLNKSHG